jgi:hypothetical protein
VPTGPFRLDGRLAAAAVVLSQRSAAPKHGIGTIIRKTGTNNLRRRQMLKKSLKVSFVPAGDNEPSCQIISNKTESIQNNAC